MTTIYCDEAGNSGESLLDQDQPNFVLASNDFSADFNHVVEWGKQKTDRFDVIHDNSKAILATEEHFRKMLAGTDEQSSMVGYDRRQFSFPLRAKSLTQADSKSHQQIQLADICAGSIAHYLRQKSLGEVDEVKKIIDDFGCLKWVVGAVYPSMDITPEQLGTDRGAAATQSNRLSADSDNLNIGTGKLPQHSG